MAFSVFVEMINLRIRAKKRTQPVADGCQLEGETVVETRPGAAPRALFERHHLGLAGAHNLENALAATAVCSLAGATEIQAPVQKDDPDKRGGFRDAGGTTWWVSTQVDG